MAESAEWVIVANGPGGPLRSAEPAKRPMLFAGAHIETVKA